MTIKWWLADPREIGIHVLTTTDLGEQLARRPLDPDVLPFEFARVISAVSTSTPPNDVQGTGESRAADLSEKKPEGIPDRDVG